MVAIPEDCLEKLKCSVCGYYLSCSPVYLKHNGDNLCGRCTVPHEEEHLAIRNNSYETVASVMSFPCKFKTVGCSKQLAWSQVKYHEEGCEYSPYNCPTIGCNWSGFQRNLKQHYEKNHVNLLVEHPGNIKPNITKDIERHYLMPVLGLLFILHLKYVVSSSKLWYCVHFLGNTRFASFFEYVLEITAGDSSNIKMKKTVQSANSNVLNQDTSIEINVNNMLGMGVINNFDDAVFTVSIKLNNNKCVACNNEVTSSVKLTNEGCFCQNCEIKEDVENDLLPATEQSVVACKNANCGCAYQDIPLNLLKHEKWFCKKDTRVCELCNKEYKTGLYNHFKSSHGLRITRLLPSNIYRCDNDYKGSFIYSDVLFCYQFMFSNSLQKFEIQLVSELPKQDLKHFLCKVKLSNPESNYCIELPLNYNNASPDYDWNVEFYNDRNNSIICVTVARNNYITKKYNLEIILTKET